MYKVVKNFTDLKDRNHKYLAGDTFPRKGLFVSKARIEELSTNKNRRGEPMIVEIPDESEEKSAPKKSGRKKTDVK